MFYSCQPVAECHPDRLAVVGVLYGVQPASICGCRTLELGCADGGHLLPLAELLPGSEFWGIDVSPAEVASANQAAGELGLSNIRFDVKDLRDIAPSDGQFDFILCHGVFSWVPADVQASILRICAENLTDQGVACINYNTFPGWHYQGMVRDFLRLAAGNVDDPGVCVERARRALHFWSQYCAERPDLYGRDFAGRLRGELNRSANFLCRAYLDVENKPLYFREFVQRSERHGLQYLGDAATGRRWTSGHRASIETSISELVDTRVEREQLIDFLAARASRYSLLCPDTVALSDEPRLDRLSELLLGAELQPDPPLPGTDRVVFRAPSGRNIATEDGQLKRALRLMSQRWPQFVCCGELADQGNGNDRNAQLLAQLWDCVTLGLVQLRTIQPTYTDQIERFPRSTKTARRQARRGVPVTNLAHLAVELTPAERAVLERLDGETDTAGLVRALKQVDQSRSDPGEGIRRTLESLAGHCLLLKRGF